MISWRNKPVRVQARLVPRFFWTTASIDVILEDKCILRTGGQFKFTGSHSVAFTDGRSEHQADLTWGRASGDRFPYQLRIDGATVSDLEVEVENWPMGYIPVLILIFVPLFIFGLHVLHSHINE